MQKVALQKQEEQVQSYRERQRVMWAWITISHLGSWEYIKTIFYCRYGNGTTSYGGEDEEDLEGDDYYRGEAQEDQQGGGSYSMGEHFETLSNLGFSQELIEMVRDSSF